MQRSRTYIYQSGHLSIWLRVYVFATLAMLIVFFVFDIPLWISPVISSCFLGAVYLVNLGYIQVSGSGTRILINSLHARIELSLPLETHGWWHYIHRGKAYANDIHAVLHVIDANGNEVYFSETIMFETRHPNEVPFRDERIPDDASVIRIQRIDKLITFLNTDR